MEVNVCIDPDPHLCMAAAGQVLPEQAGRSKNRGAYLSLFRQRKHAGVRTKARQMPAGECQ